MNLKTKIVTVLAIGIWLMPPFANFSAAQTANTSQPQPSAIISTDQTIVTVTSVQTNPSVSIGAAALGSGTACDLSGLSTATLVQDQGALNLNQPASCFSFTTATNSIQQSLSVMPIRFSATVKVAASPVPSLLPSYDSSGALPTSLPTLPLPVFGLLLVIAAALVAEKVKNRPTTTSKFIFHQSLSQLQMMRC